MNLILGGLNVLQGFSSLASGIVGANALRAQGEYQSRMLRLNAEISRLKATDAIKRGEKTVEEYNRKVSSLIGSQRAGFAGQGVIIEDGSAAEVQAETKQLAAEDVITIRSNAWREAWGYRVQAVDFEGQARMAQIGADFQATQSILTGVAEAASSGIRAGYYFQKAVQSGTKPPAYVPDVPKSELTLPELGSSLRSSKNPFSMRLGNYQFNEPTGGYQPAWTLLR